MVSNLNSIICIPSKLLHFADHTLPKLFLRRHCPEICSGDISEDITKNISGAMLWRHLRRYFSKISPELCSGDISEDIFKNISGATFRRYFPKISSEICFENTLPKIPYRRYFAENTLPEILCRKYFTGDTLGKVLCRNEPGKTLYFA